MEDFSQGKCISCLARKNDLLRHECGHSSCAECRGRSSRAESQRDFPSACAYCKPSSFRNTQKSQHYSPGRAVPSSEYKEGSSEGNFQMTPPFDVGEEKYNKRLKSPGSRALSPGTRRKASSPRESSAASLFNLKEEVKAAYRCLTHNQEFTLFCKDEKKLCCVECVFDDTLHKRHNVVSIKAAMSLIVQENRQLKKEVDERANVLDAVIDTCARGLETLRKSKESYERAIPNIFSELHRELEQRQAWLNEKLEAVFKSQFLELDARASQASFLKSCIAEFQNLGGLKSLESQVYAYSAFSILLRNLPRFSLEKESHAKESPQFLEFPTLGILKKQIEAFGEFPAAARGAKNHSGTPSPRTGNELRPPNTWQERTERNGAFNQLELTEKRLYANSGSNPKKEAALHLFTDSSIISRLDLASQEAFYCLLPSNMRRTRKLFSLSNDGPSSAVFHAKCDKKGPYFALVKANKHVFGYHLLISFSKAEGEDYSDKSWIFSLVNDYGLRPLKFPVKKEKAHLALRQSKGSPCLGTTTENMQDLWINLDDPRRSLSRIGYVYEKPENVKSEILAGSYTDWSLEEYEVFTYETWGF